MTLSQGMTVEARNAAVKAIQSGELPSMKVIDAVHRLELMKRPGQGLKRGGRRVHFYVCQGCLGGWHPARRTAADRRHDRRVLARIARQAVRR